MPIDAEAAREPPSAEQGRRAARAHARARRTRRVRRRQREHDRRDPLGVGRAWPRPARLQHGRRRRRDLRARRSARCRPRDPRRCSSRGSRPGCARSARPSPTSSTRTSPPTPSGFPSSTRSGSTICSLDLERQGREELHAEGFADDEIYVERSVDMKYVDQVHECRVEIPRFTIDADAIADIEDAFHRRHEALYTYCERDNVPELHQRRGQRLRSLTQSSLDPRSGRPPRDDPTLTRHVPPICRVRRVPTDTRLRRRLRSASATSSTGLAIVEEESTTIVVFAGSTLTLARPDVYVMTGVIGGAACSLLADQQPTRERPGRRARSDPHPGAAAAPHRRRPARASRANTSFGSQWMSCVPHAST